MVNDLRCLVISVALAVWGAVGVFLFVLVSRHVFSFELSELEMGLLFGWMIGGTMALLFGLALAGATWKSLTWEHRSKAHQCAGS